MLRYIARRIGYMFVTIFIIITVTFSSCAAFR